MKRKKLKIYILNFYIINNTFSHGTEFLSVHKNKKLIYN